MNFDQFQANLAVSLTGCSPVLRHVVTAVLVTAIHADPRVKPEGGGHGSASAQPGHEGAPGPAGRHEAGWNTQLYRLKFGSLRCVLAVGKEQISNMRPRAAAGVEMFAQSNLYAAFGSKFA